MSSGLVFSLGIIVCLTGSFLTAVSNVVLKYLDNINDALEAKGEERLPSCNYYSGVRFATLIGGATGDLVSMAMLPYGVWAGLNVSNLIFYMLLAVPFLNDPLEPPEAAVAGLITLSVVGCAIFGPEPVDKDMTGTEDFTRMDLQQFFVIFPLTIMLYIGMMYLQRTTLYEIKNNPEKYPPGYMPRPMSLYNMSGPVAFGILTCFAQVSIKVTVDSLSPINAWIIIPLLCIVAFYPVHLMNLSFMADELHAVTCVPAHIMCTMLFNSLYAYILFESQPRIPGLYIFSLELMIVACFAYVYVEDKIYVRDELKEQDTNGKENQESILLSSDHLPHANFKTVESGGLDEEPANMTTIN